MTKLNKIHLIAIIVIILLMILQGIAKHEPTVPLMTEEEKTAAFEEAYQYYNKLGPWDNTKRQQAKTYFGAKKLFPESTTFVPLEEYLANEEVENLLCLDNPSSCTTTSLSLGMGFGLTIQVPTPCVDTHLLEDVSCADKAAIVKYRKAINDIEVKRLQKEIEEMERAPTYDDNGVITDPGTVEI